MASTEDRIKILENVIARVGMGGMFLVNLPKHDRLWTDYRHITS